MPEIPDLTVYIDALNTRIVGRAVRGVRLMSPFVLRSVEPPITAVHDRTVREVSRLGKRIVLAFDDELFVVVHLMIAGRLRWRDNEPTSRRPGEGGREAGRAAPSPVAIARSLSEADARHLRVRPWPSVFHRSRLAQARVVATGSWR